MFGTPSSTPAFGTPSSTPPSGTPSSTPLFGTPSTPAFAAGGFGSSLFSTPLASQTQQQQQTSLFQQPSTTGFGFQQQQKQNPFATPLQTTPFPSPPPPPHLSTQMAFVAPLLFSLADRDIQAIVDAYKEDPGNLKYAFKIMWAESMAKLEGMEGPDRERLWPQLVQGFKDLSHRLKLQDEVIVSDAERLQMTQINIKMLQRHFQAVALPRIERMRRKERSLQRHLLRVMRIMEALEGKGFRLPLTKAEAELAEKSAAIIRQLKGSGAELSRRVQNLLTVSRVQENGIGAGGSLYIPGSTKIHEQSLADMQEVLQQQTEAIARLGNVLKRDNRDMEIMMAEGTEMQNN
ncbi:PREDICTED: nuclear pore complex protein NUP54-like isoform X2 [Populus euphratica]|uniref:Nuclear pore complex protein NUP54-like isoform X2 n=1 Tax=Populus euphratica TaxID=75702 RepID=A0AAJ6TMD2_POPEU|nr:PREDICTED: nuclear pore complex protein NUP54-like isoform X2 [Populus euphratica]XP_011029679.1 PREDICTED: nuclear pore complex protein NUP54-like isoform X2 [Populus euphratica]